MKRLIWFRCPALLLLLPLLVSCRAAPPEERVESEDALSPVYQKISAVEAKAILDGDLPFILLDVRTEAEFLEKRIAGAILIPDDEIASRAEQELPEKDALILVYCRSGRRSAQAAAALASMGYTNVYDFGGILDWPYETTGG